MIAQPRLWLSGSGRKTFKIKLTIEMMIAPSTAVQNPSTFQPRSNKPASQDVSSNMQALITTRNRPKVSKMIGAVKSAKIGLMIAFKMPKINATTNKVMILRVMLELVRLMPLSIHVATASAAALTTSLTTHLIELMVPRTASSRIAPR
jgi:hypothetical protein